MPINAAAFKVFAGYLRQRQVEPYAPSADENERTLSLTENTERLVQDSASKSSDAPICNALTGNKFAMGTPNEEPDPTPKL